MPIIRRIKNHWSYIMVLMSMLSCTRETVPTITIDTRDVQLNHEAGSVDIMLTSDKPWRATSTVDWCKVLPESGSVTIKPVKISVYCDKNLTLLSRHGVLSFEIEGCSTSLNVYQDGADLADLNNTLEITSDGQIVEIPIRHKTGISVEIEKGGDNWLRRLEDKRLKEQTTLVFEASENISVDRTCKIFITGEDIDEEVIVKQKGSIIEFSDNAIKSFLISHFDTNSDGCLTKEEAIRIKELYLPQIGVKSWKDLEYLTELEVLEIYLRDPVGARPDFRVFHNLRILNLSILSSGYDSLDLSMTGKLEVVSFGEFRNKKVDLSNNSYLKAVNFYSRSTYTELIDLNGCDKLEEFTCWYNNSIKSLDLSIYPTLKKVSIKECNHLQRIILGDQPYMNVLECLHCESLWELSITDGRCLEKMDCRGCNLVNLDLSACPELSELHCSSNKLSSLDLCGLVMLDYVDARYNEDGMSFYFNEGQRLPGYFQRDPNTQIIYRPSGKQN